jgi:hypothetical protein
MAISQYGNEYYGLSGDVKPLGTPLNGRKFTEMDTSKEYRFDAENQQWLQQSGGGGGSTTLAGLTDVDITDPTDGQTLVYDATSEKWENGAGGGSGAMVVHETEAEEGVFVLDHTYAEIVTAAPFVVSDVVDDSRHLIKWLTAYGVGTGETPRYFVAFSDMTLSDMYVADNENGYPVLSQPG